MFVVSGFAQREALTRPGGNRKTYGRSLGHIQDIGGGRITPSAIAILHLVNLNAFHFA